jgi:hypothetical protein
MPEIQTKGEAAEFDVGPLRGKIAESCGTMKRFADKMGVSEAVMSSRIRGKTAWTRKDVAKAAGILGLYEKPEELIRVFFPKNS